MGYSLFFLMGVTLGIFGGGGALLSLPILVYFFKVPVVLATQYSLLMVGSAALIGFLNTPKVKVMAKKELFLFLLPSLLAVFVSRNFLLPAIPHEFVLFGFDLKRDFVLMLLFALILFISGIKMFAPPSKLEFKEDPWRKQKTLVVGAFVGVLAGTLGAGGGFLIVPALVLLLGLEMKVAVKSSLVIIAIQSLFGFSVGLLQHRDLDSTLLLVSVITASLGILLGTKLSRRFTPKFLRVFFGLFILAISIGIIIEQLIKIS